MKESKGKKTALNASHELIYEWDVKKGKLNWTGNVKELLKLDSKKASSRENFLSIIHKDDLSEYSSEIKNAITNNDTFDINYRILPIKDGNPIYINDSGKILIENKTKAKKVVGTIKIMQENTERLLTSGSDLNNDFINLLGKVIIETSREGGSGSYLKISIDNLALLIAWYNMQFADEIIEKLGKKIEKLLGKDAILRRIYIDQFGVILKNTAREQAEIKARKIYNLIQDFESENFKKPMHITASLGSVDFPGSTKNPTDAVNKAYLALNIAKNSSESFYFDYHEAERQQSHSKSQTMLMHYIHDAVKDNKICFAYQPMIEAKTGKVRAHECLIRIAGEDGRINSPGAIIPIAEKMGFIDTIDQLVLEKVVENLKKNKDITLSFNASSLTTDNPKWLKQCTKLMKDYDIASRVIVEITETAAQRDLRETAYFVASLQALGCLVALDDFGAGYTSFRQLKTLSVDIIKIDGAFIRDIVNYPDNRLFVKTLLDFTNCYGLKTVAECVEDGESAKILMDMNVDYLQGYYFGMPEISPTWIKK